MENTTYINQLESVNKIGLTGFYNAEKDQISLFQGSLSSTSFDGNIGREIKNVYLYNKYFGGFNLKPGQYILVNKDSYDSENEETFDQRNFCQIIGIRIGEGTYRGSTNPEYITDEATTSTGDTQVTAPVPSFTSEVYIDYIDDMGLINTITVVPPENSEDFPSDKFVISSESWSEEYSEYKYLYEDIQEIDGKNILHGEDQTGNVLHYIPGQEKISLVNDGDTLDLILDMHYQYPEGFEGIYIELLITPLAGDIYTITVPPKSLKSLGSSGWYISSEGNSIFNNVAVRGTIEATNGNFDGFLTVDKGTMKIGKNVNTFNDKTSSGIFINDYNFWYDDGSFEVGSINNYLVWNTNTLDIKGNITAGTIGSGWKISANRIEAGNGADYVALSTSINGLRVHSDFQTAIVKQMVIDRQEINGLNYSKIFVQIEFPELLTLMQELLPEFFVGYDEATTQQQTSMLDVAVSQYFANKSFIFKNEIGNINLFDTDYNNSLSSLANRYIRIDHAGLYQVDLNEDNHAIYTSNTTENNITLDFTGEDYGFIANLSEIIDENISNLYHWSGEVVELPSEKTFRVIKKSVIDNVATMTTDVTHDITAGKIITISKVDNKFNGTYTVLASPAPTSTKFSFTKISGDVPETQDGNLLNGYVSYNTSNEGSYLFWTGDPQPDLAPFSIQSNKITNVYSLVSNDIQVVNGISTGELTLNGYQTFISSTTPSGASSGDIWIKNLSNPELYKYDGADWIGSITDLSAYAPLSGATFTGDISVNGGDINTTATTATLFNANTTTLNIGSAATTISIGNTSHTGTTTIQHDLYVTGNITFGGTSTTLSATNLNVTDSLIYLSVDNAADILDIGWIGAYKPASTHLHTGFVRDSSDGKWKLFSNVSTEPTTVVDFTGATYDTLKIGALEVTDDSTTRTNLGLGTMATETATDYLTTSIASSTYAPKASPTFTGSITVGESIIKSTSTTITSSSATTISSIPVGLGMVLAECVVLLSSASDASYYTSKILIRGDAYSADLSEYAIIEDGSMNVVFTVVPGSNILLKAAITNSGVTAKVISTYISAVNAGS